MQIDISTIELDQSTQCRAEMRQETIDEYAEMMKNGDQFPPIVTFGTKDANWLGDGWHRVLAARAIGKSSISAIVSHGGRLEAIKHALKANMEHGLRRSNKDKQRSIEIACKEFPKVSNVVIADMCGVSRESVRTYRNSLQSLHPESRIGSDGKEYPATITQPERKPGNLEHLYDRQDRPSIVVPTPKSELPDPIRSSNSWEPDAEEVSEALEQYHEPVETKDKKTGEFNMGEQYVRNIASVAITQLESIPARNKHRRIAYELVLKFVERELENNG